MVPGRRVPSLGAQMPDQNPKRVPDRPLAEPCSVVDADPHPGGGETPQSAPDGCTARSGPVSMTTELRKARPLSSSLIPEDIERVFLSVLTLSPSLCVTNELN